MRKEISRFVLRLLLTPISLTCFLTAIEATTPGDLDPTFGVGGKVTDGPGQSWDLTVQPDGKIVIIIGDSTLARYNEDGTPDNTFGINGRLAAPIFISSVRIQPDDGKIVALGYVCPCYDWGGESFAVIRLNPDGSSDASFGDNGTVLTTFNFHAVGWATAIDSNGKIVVGGWTWTRIGDVARDNFALARYNSDGSLDLSFDGDGKVVTQVTPNGATYGQNLNEEIHAVLIQPDGKIVAVGGGFGLVAPKFLAVRYNADGSLDSTFGSGGKVVSTLAGAYQGAALLQPDGKVVSAGGKLVRLNPDGSFDSSFDVDGVIALSNIYFTKIVRQSDGKLVAMGYGGSNSNYDFTLVRFNVTGSFDTTFGGGDGVATVDFDYASDYPEGGLAIDSKGRAVFSGHSGNPSSVSLARIILRSGKAAPFDYDGDGKSDFSVSRAGRTWYIAESGSGLMRVTVPFNYRVGGWGVLAPADYDGDGTTDIATGEVYHTDIGEFNQWHIRNSSTGAVSDQIVFGSFSDLLRPADYDGDGKADYAAWRPSDGTWHILFSKSGSTYVQQWGLPGDNPVPADFDGDGKTDLAVWRPSDGKWYIANIATGTVTVVDWGLDGDIPVVGDYSGDGRSDFAVYRGTDNTWYVMYSSDFSMHITQWGSGDDLVTPGDYDGDGKQDLAVWRRSQGTWYVLTSSNSIITQQFGLDGDTPTELAFIYWPFLDQSVSTSFKP